MNLSLYFETKSNILALMVFGIALVVFFLVHRFLVCRLREYTRLTSVSWDNALVEAVDTPLAWAGVLVSFTLASLFLSADAETLNVFTLGKKLVFIILLTWTALRILAAAILHSQVAFFKENTTRSLVLTLMRVILISISLLLIMDSLGISISPLLASLGIGSLAIALALQETLGNFFNGIYLQIDKPIRVGDFVKIEGSIEGYVEKIGWRSTRIRMLSNNMTIVPNGKLAASNVVNFNLPSEELAVLVEVGVSYNSSLSKVEEATIAAATEAQRTVTGAIPEFRPFIRFHTFADSSINFTVILRAKTFVDNYLLKHEFIKILHRTYAKEGIEIPFPQRTVHIANSRSPQNTMI